MVKKQCIENRTFDEISIGDEASVSRTLTWRNAELFAAMSGDVNPAHVDEEFASSNMFHKIIAHGMWGGALIWMVLGTELPRPGAVYVSQSLRFLRPVGLGDTVTVTVRATAKDDARHRVTFDCNVVNQAGQVVISGPAEVIAPTDNLCPKRTPVTDFKTNEYANLIGGAALEPEEENPMLGFRGASRYYSERYLEGFALECRAIKRLREEMGFRNVVVMIPFCRSPGEADRVLEVMAENGLEVYVMCEIPSNAILAGAFAERFDGFSIGSNDLMQLTLGVDQDSEMLSDLFNEQNDAVKWMIREVIARAHEAGARVGLCGQAPSDHPEFAGFLVACGIDSMSVSPDSFLPVKRRVAAVESGGSA